MVRRTRSKQGRSQAVGDLLLTGEPGLGELVRQARKLDALDHALGRLLDPGMSERVRVAALRERCLVLVTPSAALATRLKMDTPALLKSLQASGVTGVSRIEVRTAPLPARSQEERRSKRLPDIARESLERFARDSGDPEILEQVLGQRRKP
jgi:hypothetical protein